MPDIHKSLLKVTGLRFRIRPLLIACKYGNVDIVAHILDKYKHTYYVIINGLKMGCYYGNLEIIKYIATKYIYMISFFNFFPFGFIRGKDQKSYLNIFNFLVYFLYHRKTGICPYNNILYNLKNDKNPIEILKNYIYHFDKLLENDLDELNIKYIIKLLCRKKSFSPLEYFLFTKKLDNKNITYKKEQKMEKLLSQKDKICAEIEYNPKLINNQMGKKCMDKVRQKKLAFFEKHKSEMNFSSTFEDFAKADIQYWWALSLMQYRWEHAYYNNIPSPMQLPDAYYDFLDQINPNNETAVNNIKYIWFLEQYLEYMASNDVDTTYMVHLSKRNIEEQDDS